MIDTIIYNGFIITMEGNGIGLIENGAVGIKGNEIEVVGKTDEILKEYQAHRYLDAMNKVVMPGFINAHMHSAMGLLRGLAQDVNNWLQRGAWPFMAIMDDDEIVQGSMINIMEAVKGGITTCCDFDVPMRKMVKNYAKIGARARVCETIMEQSTETRDEVPIGELYPFDSAIGNYKLNQNIKLIEEWNHKENGRITCLIGPQGPDMVSKELLLEIENLAKKYDTNIHMHVACGDRETEQMVKRYGKRTIPYLDEIGILNERLMGVHLSVATKDELALYASKKASMIYCAISEAIVDGNVPPAAEFLEFSPKLALGTDQTAGNNCCNMFDEMKFAAILNKCKLADPTVFPAWKVLRMATIDGAKAIGLDKEVGSLKKGKKADIIIINLEYPELQPIITDPIRNIVPNLVYSANGSEVETVIIDGNFIVDNHEFTTINEKQIIADTKKAIESFSKKAKQKINKGDIPIAKMMEQEEL